MAEDIKALVAAVDAAEAAFQVLIDERRANRDSMTRAAFKEYNTDTRRQQVDTQAAVTAAILALQAALTNTKQTVLVQALEGRDTLGGAS